MFLLSTILFLALTLFILYETDAVDQYIRLFRLEKVAPHFQEYNQIIESGGWIKYLDYLKKVDNRFLVQLFSCPVCFSVWFSTLLSLITWQIIECPIINFFSLVGFYFLKILNKYSS